MRSVLTVTQETVLLLRRDYIFLPLILITIGIILFAKTAGTWSIFESHKFLFDICFTTLHIAGSLATIFWSTKLFSESRQDGSLEVLMATPISRTSVFLGRYFGLAFVLFLYCMTSVIILQVLTKYYLGWSWFNWRELLPILYYFEGWLAIAAVGVMFASMGGQTTAFFTTGLTWFIGLTSAGFALALDKEQSEMARNFATGIAKVWNLQNFNLAQFVGTEMFPSNQELMFRALYGVTIILIALTVGTIFFNKKDAVA